MTGAHASLQDLVERGAEPDVVDHLSGCPACRARARLVSGPPEEVDEVAAVSLSAGRSRAAEQLVGAIAIGGWPPASDEPGDLEPGRVVDRWVVEERLGAGGMGVVYRVQHRTLGSHNALKVLSLASRSQRARLLREGRAQGRLRHPNVVAVIDVVEVDGSPALVLELVEGTTLHALARDVALSPAEIDGLAQGVLRGVAAAHRAGLVHRDLKPANVLVARADGVWLPKVADFGLVGRTEGDEDVSASEGPVGTPAYMAPEQIRDGRAATPRSDVFSLGAVLYELLSGRRAHLGRSVVDVYDQIRSGARPPLPGTVPRHQAAAVERALSTNPADRFADAEGLLAAWTTPQTTPARRSVAWVTALGLGGAVAAVVVGVWLRRAEVPAAAVVSAPEQAADLRVTARSSDLQVFALSVSPDGSEVALTDAVGVRRQPIDGGDERVVMEGGPFHGVDWFPDGAHLLVHGTYRGQDGVWRVGADGEGAELLASGMVDGVKLSPDGARFSLVDDAGLWVQSVDGGERRKVAPPVTGWLAGIAWSPASDAFALVRGLPGAPSSLERVPLDGGEPRVLLNDRGLHAYSIAPLAWLPGDRLVYVLAGKDQATWMGLDGASTAADATEARALRTTRGFDITHLDASLDGSRVVYSRVTSTLVPHVLELAGDPRPRRLDESDWNQLPVAFGGPDEVWVASSRGRGELLRLPLAGGPARVVLPGRVPLGRMNRVGARWVWLESGRDGARVVRWDDGGAPELADERLACDPTMPKALQLRCGGGRCLASSWDAGARTFAWIDPVTGAATPLDVPDSGGADLAWDLDPTGTRLALARAPSHLEVRDLDTGATETWPLAVRLPSEIAWEAGGDAIVAAGLTWESDAYRIDEVRRDGSRTLWASRSWYGYRLVPSPFGPQLAFGVSVFDDDLWATSDLGRR